MQATEWDALTAHLREIELIDSVGGVLVWDEQTYMPKKAAELRGDQMALLSRLGHARITDPRIARWLEQLDDASDVRRACKRNLGRAYRRERRVPEALVDELARARSEGFQLWIEAKQAKDFSRFAPILERLVDLSKRRASAIDGARHPYEVLLEQYDPGTTVDGLRSMFARLREGLVPLLDAIAARPQSAPLGDAFALDRQWALSHDIAARLGYDLEGGRLDRAEHPFSTGQGKGDVRITAHLLADDLLGGLGGTVHEVGHALYEQGLPHRHAGTTVCEAASYGLHESQSRFWENFIGRSLPFSRFLAGRVAHHYPERALGADAIYAAQNRVERGLVRVKADEVTYNLHIIVRFELELALFDGTLAVRDLPAAWNDKYRTYLGVTPPDDGIGVLQDVHWSGASFGYFPSYTLGNLYAASLGRTIEAAIPDLWARVERGDFAPVLAWLREKIHDFGHLNEAPEIVRAAVGERDHVEDLLAHLWGRQGALYGVTRPA